MQIKDHIVSFC